MKNVPGFFLVFCACFGVSVQYKTFLTVVFVPLFNEKGLIFRFLRVCFRFLSTKGHFNACRLFGLCLRFCSIKKYFNLFSYFVSVFGSSFNKKRLQNYSLLCLSFCLFWSLLLIENRFSFLSPARLLPCPPARKCWHGPKQLTSESRPESTPPSVRGVRGLREGLAACSATKKRCRRV